MVHRFLGTGLLALVVTLAPPVAAQNAAPPDSLALRAAAIIEHEVGRWASTWEWYGVDGTVVRTQQGIEEFAFVVGKSIVEVRTESDGNVTSAGLRFYSPTDRTIITFSVSPDGNPWTLREDIETRVVQSDPHTSANGRVIILRWTPQKTSENEMVVLMEQSRDGGATWFKRNVQTMRRMQP